MITLSACLFSSLHCIWRLLLLVSLCGLKNMGSVFRVHTSRWVFECGIGGFACQRVFAIQSQSTGVLGIFLLFYVRGRVHERFFCPDECVTGFFLLSSLWKRLKSQYGEARVGYFDTFSTCMDPVFFFLASNFAEENSRAVAPFSWMSLS